MKIKMNDRMKSLHLNNKGFSLVELLVVIAIMIVLVGVAVASTSVIDSSYVKEVERGIEDYVSLARQKSMSVSAKEWYVIVTEEDEQCTVKLCKTIVETVDGTNVEKEIIIDSNDYNNKIKVSFDDGSGSREINSDMPLKIYFDPSTGKVNKVTVGGVAADISDGIGRFAMERNSYDIVMKLFYNTGKCERE